MGIYNQYNLEIADEFDSPVQVSESLMSLVPCVYPSQECIRGLTSFYLLLRVSAPDGTTVDDLRMVKVPHGLIIEILDFDIY
jgi:hypothetical protein